MTTDRKRRAQAAPENVAPIPTPTEASRAPLVGEVSLREVDADGRPERIVHLGTIKPGELAERMAEVRGSMVPLETQTAPEPMRLQRIKVWVRGAADREEARRVYTIASRFGRDAYDEAIARFKADLVIEHHTEVLDPILIERLGEDSTRATYGRFGDWFGKVFRQVRRVGGSR